MNQFADTHFSRYTLFLVLIMFSWLAYGGISPAKEDIVFVIENSQFAEPFNKKRVLQASIKAFLKNTSQKDRVALILFSDRTSLKVPLAPVNQQQISDILESLDADANRTQYSNSAAGLERALHELKSAEPRGAGRSIILFTQDSINSGSSERDANFSKWMSDVLTQEAANESIRVFCIAITRTNQGWLLKRLANTTGGMFYSVTKLEETPSIFEAVIKSIFW
jgi:Ca-activated chloride channel family protein